MSSPRSRRRISEIISGGKLFGLMSFRCYGNSDVGEMYSISNFHFSLARH